MPKTRTIVSDPAADLFLALVCEHLERGSSMRDAVSLGIEALGRVTRLVAARASARDAETIRAVL